MPKEQYATIGAGNGMALITVQAIVFRNDGHAYWRIYASLVSINQNC